MNWNKIRLAKIAFVDEDIVEIILKDCRGKKHSFKKNEIIDIDGETDTFFLDTLGILCTSDYAIVEILKD